MDAYQRSFDIRWGDLDPNRHVANATFVSLLTETRMSIMAAFGFDQAYLEREQIGPVIFHEDFYYIREVKPNSSIRIDVRMAGVSEDWGFMKQAQRIFLPDGNIAVYSEVLFAWFDLNTRKLRIPSSDILAAYQKYPRIEDFSIIDPGETRARHVPYAAVIEPLT